MSECIFRSYNREDFHREYDRIANRRFQPQYDCTKQTLVSQEKECDIKEDGHVYYMNNDLKVICYFDGKYEIWSPGQ